MELDTILQIFFGISTTLISILAIWFTWYNTRGRFSYHDTFHRPAINLHSGRHIPSQRTSDDILPLHHNRASPENRYLWTRRRMLVEDTFGSFAMADWAHLPTGQQNGRVSDVADPQWLIARYLLSDSIDRCISKPWRCLQSPDMMNVRMLSSVSLMGAILRPMSVLIIDLWVLWSICRTVREFGVMGSIVAG